MKTVRSILLVLMPLLCGCAQWDAAVRRHEQQQSRSMADAARHLATSHHPPLNDPRYADGWHAGYRAALQSGAASPPLGPPQPHGAAPRPQFAAAPTAFPEASGSRITGPIARTVSTRTVSTQTNAMGREEERNAFDSAFSQLHQAQARMRHWGQMARP